MIRRPLVLGASVLALALMCAPAWTQGNSDQQPIFTYVSEWGVPRAQWGEMEKVNADNKTILDPLVADGTLLGYGSYENRIHSEGGYTHGGWFQATSVANILKALEEFYSRPGVTAPVLAASEHHDYLMVSTMYGSKPISNSTGYLRVISAQLQPGREDEFMAAYSRYIKPIFDKMLADGTIVAYQLDMEFNIQNAPGRFFSVVVVRDADAFDKVRMAVWDMFSKNPAALAALVSATVDNSRNDFLAHVTTMTHK